MIKKNNNEEIIDYFHFYHLQHKEKAILLRILLQLMYILFYFSSFTLISHGLIAKEGNHLHFKVIDSHGRIIVVFRVTRKKINFFDSRI